MTRAPRKKRVKSLAPDVREKILLQDFVAAQDQIVVLAAQRGIFLPTHDEKVEMSKGDRERAIA
ncbi:MAG: hypothetical protein WBQ91_14875, partial [Candidatus Acidiferrum sp.]